MTANRRPRGTTAIVEGAGAEEGSPRVRREGRVTRRGPQPIEPGTAVLRPRRSEGRPGELLGIEAEGRLLGRVAADRQGAGHGLGLEIAAEPRQGRAKRLSGRGRPEGFMDGHSILLLARRSGSVNAKRRD